MTDTRLLDVQFGLHASAADFTTTPATVSTIELLSGHESLMPRSRESLDREVYSVDNGRLPSLFGVKDLSAISLGMHFRGVSGNAGGAFTPQTSMEQCRILDSFFGAAAAAITGAAPTVASGSAGLVVNVSTTVLANGDMILIPTAAGTDAREIVSGGGTLAVTVDRVLSGVPTVGGTVVRTARWNVSTALTQHVHGYIRAEGDTYRRDYFGCLPDSLTLTCGEQKYVEMQVSFMPNDWTDVAEANPAYVAPVAGSPIVVADAPFWLGGVEFLVRDLKVVLKHDVSARRSTTGVNGITGYVARRKHELTISGALYLGDNAGALNELVDDSGTPSLGTLTGDGVSAGVAKTMVDVAVQLGTAAGSFAYVRIPAADVRGSVKDVDGYPMFVFDATATRPSTGSPFRLGVG